MGKRGLTWIAIATVGVLVPGLLLVLVGFTPDVTLRVGDAGRFISSATSGGGFLSDAVSTVQTNTGSIAVYGPISAERGHRLWIEDRLKSGPQLCVDATPPSCTRIAGQWSGTLRAVRHQRYAFTWLAESISDQTLAQWFFFGILASMMSAGVLASFGSVSPETQPDSSKTG